MLTPQESRGLITDIFRYGETRLSVDYDALMGDAHKILDAYERLYEDSPPKICRRVMEETTRIINKQIYRVIPEETWDALVKALESLRLFGDSLDIFRDDVGRVMLKRVDDALALAKGGEAVTGRMPATTPDTKWLKRAIEVGLAYIQDLPDGAFPQTRRDEAEILASHILGNWLAIEGAQVKALVAAARAGRDLLETFRAEGADVGYSQMASQISALGASLKPFE